MTKQLKEKWTLVLQSIIPVIVALLAFYGAYIGHMNNQKTSQLSYEVQRLQRNDDKIKTVASTIINSSKSLTGPDDTQALLHYIALYEMVAGLYSNDKEAQMQKQHLMSSVIRMGAVIDKKSVWNYLYEKSNTDRNNFIPEDIEFIKQYAYIHLANEQVATNNIGHIPVPTKPPIGSTPAPTVIEIMPTSTPIVALEDPMKKFLLENPDNNSNSSDNVKFREGWVYIGPISKSDLAAYKTSNRSIEVYTTQKSATTIQITLDKRRKTIEQTTLPFVGDTVKASTDIYFRKQAPSGAGKNRVLGAVEDPCVITGQYMVIQEVRVYTCDYTGDDANLKVIWAKVKIRKDGK